jgi:WD40 repeat protein
VYCGVSPDGKTLAATHNFSFVRLLSTASWEEIRTLDCIGCGNISATVFSPNGKKLFVAGISHMYMIDVETGEKLAVNDGFDADIRYTVASSREYLAIGGRDGRIVMIAMDDFK